MLGWEGPFISYVKVCPVDVRNHFNTEMKEKMIFDVLSFYLPYKTHFQGSSNFPKLL